MTEGSGQASRLKHRLDEGVRALSSAASGELEQSTAELGDAIARYTEVYDLATTGTFTIDNSGRVTTVTPPGAKLLGFPVSNLLRSSLRSFVAPQDRQRFDSLCDSAANTMDRQIGQFRMLRRRRTLFQAIIDIIPGEDVGECTLTVTEVTERMRAESAMKEAYARLAGLVEAFREREQAGAELRQRLNRVEHVSEVLLDALVPEPAKSIHGCPVACGYRAAMDEARIGGDFYDVFDLGDGNVGVLIGDVVGKGLNAAMQVSAARFTIRSYAYIDPRPARVLARANDALCRDKNSTWLTAFFAVIDTQCPAIHYASAGHEPALLRSVSGTIEWLEVRGQALGIESSFDYREACRPLHDGDTLVMVTDGIVEARRDNRHFFGIEGVEEFLLRNRHASPSDISEGVLAAVIDFTNAPLRDDAAVLVFEFASTD